MEEQYVATQYKEVVQIKPVEDVNKNSEYFLTPEQIRTLINSATSQRNKVLIEVLAFCALRRDEVRNLKIEDIDFKNGWLNLVVTKRGKRRTVPVRKDVLRDLEWLCEKRSKGFIFLSREGKGLSNTQINRIVAKAGIRAGLKNPNPKIKSINPHILRHSFSRLFLKNGGRMEVLQKLLGHSSITTTINIYGRPSLEDIKSEYERFGG